MTQEDAPGDQEQGVRGEKCVKLSVLFFPEYAPKPIK